jgi:hypothetical protein
MDLITIEDVVEVIAENIHDPDLKGMLGDPWFTKFFSNVGSWVRQNKPLTTEQAKIVSKALMKTRVYFLARGASPEGIHDLLMTPVYRNQPTLSSVMPREVRYLGNSILGFRFKRNDIIMDEIKALKSLSPLAPHLVEWQPHDRMWEIGIMDTTLDGIFAIIKKHRFHFDDDVAQALADAENAQRGISTFAVEDGMLVITVKDNVLLSSWVESALGGVPQ